MARLFVRGSSEYLEYASAIVAAPPFTMAAWAYIDDVTVNSTLVSVSDSSGSQFHDIRIQGGDANDLAKVFSYDGGVGIAVSSSGASVNTWHHIFGVWAATNSRAVLLDGGNKGTDSANISPSVDVTDVGCLYWAGAPTNYTSGHIAEAAIWNAALTDANAAELAAGFSPLCVRPDALVAYWRLIRGLTDIVGGYDLTASGTTVSAHPRIIYPRQYWTGVEVTAGGIVVPVMDHHYRMRRTA